MQHAKDGPVAMQGSRRLNAWIEQGGLPERPVRLRGLRHRWLGFWFERYASMTAQRCSAVDLPNDPLFIVGLWRTGSTALHLALDGEAHWTTPRTWQCFHPAEFLLVPPPARQQAGRPMDAGVIDTFSPQEDEFAALLLGEPSTYRAFIDPRRIDELEALLDGWRMPAASQGAPLSHRWETFLRAVLCNSPGPLLLKSPNHTFRLPWLAKRFPRAHFIWLTRRLPDLMTSNRRMWTAMVDRYGQWKLDAAALDKFLHHAVAAHDEILDWARQTIPERLCLADFDEVIHDRPNLLARIRSHLGTGLGATE